MVAHNLLVLAYYFPPMGLSGVQRISKFVKYLPDNGWRPYVVTTGPVAYYAYDQSLLDELTERDVTILRTTPFDTNNDGSIQPAVKMPREGIRKFLSKASSSLFIPDNKKNWARQAIALAREVIESVDIDVIFVSGPPFSTMMAGAQLSAETGIPLVLDYRDLWYGNQFHSYPTPWHANRHKELEHATLSRASRVIVTNRRIKERLIATYPQLTHEDVIIIPHGFDPQDFIGVPNTRPQRKAFRLTYSGIFYDFVTPVPFFKAIKKIRREHPDVELELNFVGLLRDQYKKKAQRMGIADLIIDNGYMNHDDAVAELMNSDALWMMVGDARNADTISSGKLYEYFGTGKPLLVSVPNGILRNDAQRYGAAWITEPNDVDGIATAILEMYNKWKNGTATKADPRFIEMYDRSELTSSLARVLATSLRVM